MMQKACLWDRDGTINKLIVRPDNPISCPYTFEEFELLPYIVDVLRQTKQLGYKNIVVTNQPGVKNNKPSLVELNYIHGFLISNCYVDECNFCSDTDSYFYKPNPGMLENVIMRHYIDPISSFMIGDRWKDIVPADQVGLNTIFFGEQYTCPDEYYVEPDFKINDIRKLISIVR